MSFSAARTASAPRSARDRLRRHGTPGTSGRTTVGTTASSCRADGSSGTAPPIDTDLDGLSDDAEVRRYQHRPAPDATTDGDGLTRRSRGQPLPHQPAHSGHRPRRPHRQRARSAATTPTRASATPTATASSTAAEVRRYHTNPRAARHRPRRPRATAEMSRRHHTNPRPADTDRDGRRGDFALAQHAAGISHRSALVRGLRRPPAPDDELAGPMTSDNEPTGDHHRLAQQRRLAGAVPVERLREVGRPRARRRRRRQRLDRRHGGARATRVSRMFECVATENRGFAAANNRGLEIVDAEWVLFLNPDTRDPLGDARGARVAACERGRQSGSRASGRSTRTASWTRRCGDFRTPSARSPSASARERLPLRRLVARRAGARPGALRPRDALRLDASARSCSHARRRSTTSAGWTSGSSSTARRPTSAFGCRQAGWEVVHLPQMTILHQSSTTGSDERLSGQMAFARRQYMDEALRRRPSDGGRRSHSASGTPFARSSPAAVRTRRRRRASARSALATLSRSRAASVSARSRRRASSARRSAAVAEQPTQASCDGLDASASGTHTARVRAADRASRELVRPRADARARTRVLCGGGVGGGADEHVRDGAGGSGIDGRHDGRGRPAGPA